ncbi:MAG TPA: glycine C-acetyltransferase [Candidatus Krumholzibacteria bacterium]|nr:glycine C-acetyltransferase [Candidatus Krumholzibacteria bacterium]
MIDSLQARLRETLAEIRAAGLYKDERILLSPQGPRIAVQGREVLNFCANNYLGLANHPDILAAARAALDTHGFGLSSVRFICGTQAPHKLLEQRLAAFVGQDDVILYTSCFDANGGLFETLLGPEDAVISDELNHASLIDGIRLCKAERTRYKHADMDDLEAQLGSSRNARVRLIVTDGVFSMDGDIAPLDRICALAARYEALVMVDDSHATGVVGQRGRGSAEHCGVAGKIDILTSTLGKALGGASGGFTAAKSEVIDLLRQRSRPYLFSNTVTPMVVAAGIRALELLADSTTLRDQLVANTEYFRSQMIAAGFALRAGVHPIVPIMLGDAKLAHDMARDLLDEGIYVIGFSFPVVPQGQARIRVQVSAAHERAHLDRAVAAFAKVGRKHAIVR